MFKKVNVGSVVKTESGIVLGRKIGSFKGKILIEDKSGKQTEATYGVVDEANKFYPYCTDVESCVLKCAVGVSPACRHNQKYAASAGFYVDVK